MHHSNRTRVSLLVLTMAAGLSAKASLSQNLLFDPGFESGTPVPGGVGGWNTVTNASFSKNYAHSGQWSMECYFVPSSFPGGDSVQSVAALPGAEYNLSGFGFTPATLSGQAFASLTLFFTDSNGSVLGNFYTSPPITSSSPVATWIPLSVSQVTPANAANVVAEVILFNYSLGDAVYFDDLSLTIVPEPSSALLTDLGIIICSIWSSIRYQRLKLAASR